MCWNKNTCYEISIKSSLIFLLKVLHDNSKARREVELHVRATGCRHIVNIVDVYENTYSGTKCILVVMECMEGKVQLKDFQVF